MAEPIKYVIVCGCGCSIEPIAFINDDLSWGGVGGARGVKKTKRRPVVVVAGRG